jgi:predicted thioredoxin/glutaredoxin
MKVVLVTRKNCQLCEEALSLLDDLGLEPELRDVDAESDLHSMYDWRVPVVLVDGRVVAEGRIDRDHLREAMSAP